MLSELIDRDAMIADLADWYGVPERFFRQLDQSVLDHAWLVARQHWS